MSRTLRDSEKTLKVLLFRAPRKGMSRRIWALLAIAGVAQAAVFITLGAFR